MDTFEKIRALLAEQLDIDPAKITMESDIMSDFEADSLDIVDMVMTLEDEFDIEVLDDAIETLRTITALVIDKTGTLTLPNPNVNFTQPEHLLRPARNAEAPRPRSHASAAAHGH